MKDRVNRELLLARCDFLMESQVWPLEQELDYQGWLSNFTDSEQEFAECLLNGFLYFSRSITSHLFLAAFQRLAATVIDESDRTRSPKVQWDDFKNTAVFTHVTGEDPSPTDSGYHFARLSRQFLGIDESQILTNERVIESIRFNGAKAIVFVDDFVGSGNQFCETWERVHSITPMIHASFQSEISTTGFKAFYCPVICTCAGLAKIARRAPQVTVSPAHLFDESYSALSPTTPIWPDRLRGGAEAFMKDSSIRAGITGNWKGFHDLGLLLAFEHGVPDATLPLLYHQSPNWKPLVRRT